MEAGAEEEDLLLAAAGRGEGAAFRRLTERHGDRAFSVALRITGRRGDAEDVVQEAFLRAWQHAARWRPGRARFSTWLHRVVVNLCLDRARAAARERPAPMEAAMELADPAPGAEQRLAQQERERAVLEAVRALPERQRAALALVHAGGLGQAEVAEVLELSVGAVESLLSRARRSLRERLATAEER
ncbi:sigma-70 family RNA polymerase sigma factor [Marinimicrococcus flavescens]|uniref:RNA polymerase sigma factor n=1 Tax=Marinimicrococcus flavescens TaxID=3031815 RepID=A0AAP3XQY2_9PROT|nr:sigma-70 family RNA polymerase sigma factor [Marinimicrococcus flavescens]